MVVCVCNAIKEREVRDAAKQGVHSPARVYRSLGCKLQCGQCVPFAQEIIRAELAIAC